ncbi:putative filamentation protein (Rhf1) [Aspergillus lucknowensis]|uniref:Filamentation protein n=1 Tax=Aspergillus lucknowensis TaxID=176173 RepID=A0ABR4LNH2_9EURO
MAARESEKGHRYIVALDNARSLNKWDEVPELIRKVTKHASHKTCYLDVASAEYQIITHLHRSSSSPTGRPTSSSSAGLPELIPSLLSTVDKADGSRQEVFQAQVCLGWVHYTLNEPGLAAARLPKDFEDELNALVAAGDEISPWTKVCLVKGCYIKGAAQHAVSGPRDALQTFNSLSAWLGNQNYASSSNQFLYWSEKVLADGALLAGDEVRKDIAGAHGGLVSAALRLFRAWSSHPAVKPGTPHGPHTEGSKEPVSKSSIWKSYYDLLSAVLQHYLPYAAPAGGPERPQLADEIRRVEAICEANLLREVKFPSADSGNKSIESWVEQVISNWKELCGPKWHDEELGEGGQIAVGRNVLDILYRAASRTYHSFLILRRLFHVHSALADFDLAFKALDSYIEIVSGAKERAEKSVPNEELEDEGVFMRTISEGVTLLCCFGSGKEAEKAKELIGTLRKFISSHVKDHQQGEERRMIIDSRAISLADVSATYRAIGIGLANWASWTPVNEERDDIRTEAIECLERSIAPELGDEHNYSSIYTLALLLAENRDLDAAIDYVKSALASNKDPEGTSAGFSRERDLIPLWHLLALLLSAKQEFDIAERSCEAAFEQFPAASTSLAHSDRRPSKHQQKVREQTNLKRALLDRLRNREKERIIETRMTQLAFVEVLEGPEAALNHSDQLLSLFAILFQILDLGPEGQTKTGTDQPLRPKSSSATIKSFRGSIFGRHKAASRTPDQKVTPSGEHKADSPSHSALQNSPSNVDGAPAMRVIDENGLVTGDVNASLGDPDSRKLRKRGSSVKNSDAGQDQNVSHVNGDTANHHGSEDGEPSGQYPREEAPSSEKVRNAASQAPSRPQSAKNTLGSIAHNIKHTRLESPAGHDKQPREQDIRLPLSYAFESPTGALTKFPHAQAQKHALCILAKIWLLIAGLYRRASSFDDATEACEEASKHVKRIEILTAAQDASARSFRERGWATPKSSDELWADIYAERGLLLKVQSRPHEAMEHFEEALMYNPDHPKATITLADLLLDIWDQKLPLQPPEAGVEMPLATMTPPPSKEATASKSNGSKRLSRAGIPDSDKPKTQNPAPTTEDEEPKLINRIAARERAYFLLSALTKRGTSWDNSEAWFALSRAYEAVGQTQKLKEVLWWCIELEDRRPIRHWSNLGSGVYVL